MPGLSRSLVKRALQSWHVPGVAVAIVRER